MSASRALRQSALEKRQELGLDSKILAPANEVLRLLEDLTGIGRCLVPSGDQLLAGAQAVLNLPMLTIFQDAGRSEAAQRFDAAHEYAHVFLHNGSCHCADEDLGGDDLRGTPAPGQDRVDGYSPLQRRETEANLYAAELLLPGPMLNRLFFQEGWSAAQIAEAVGVAPALVEAQMVEALLLPPVSARPEADVKPSAAPPALDLSQRVAADISAGPLLLGAGPGTGKTKTLVARCQYLVEQGVPPEKILALTFSRDAAQEMRERLAQVGVSTGSAGPWIGTFHSFGLDLLRRYGERIGLPAEVVLLGTLDAVTLLENNLPRLHLNELDNLHNPALHLGGILRQISRAKDELCPPEKYTELAAQMRLQAERAAADFAAQPGKKLKKDQEAIQKAVSKAAKAEEVAHCYTVYAQLMAEHGFLDYGDLIFRSVQLLESCPDVRAVLQAEFPHILADEYQDVNRACARMIRLLAGEDARGLWAVGDHRQSIYRFRGASPANVAAFQADYPNGQRQELAVNYRSQTPIVDCFGQIARAMTPASDMFQGWQAQRGHAMSEIPTVMSAVAPDAEGQADGMAAQMRALRSQFSYPQQAILCRTNAQAQALVALLTERDIPVLYLGALLERPEVKDLLCLLSLFSEPYGMGLLRVGALPEYAVPQTDILAFLKRASDAEKSVFDALQMPELFEGLSAEAAQGLQTLAQHLTKLDTLENDPAALLRHYLFGQSQFLRHLVAETEKPFQRVQKRLAVHELYGLALSFDRRVVTPKGETGPVNRIRDFLTHLRRQAAAGESPQGAVPEGAQDLDAVRIMTAHKAKGLEYPVVFVPNLGKGQFPTGGRSDGIPEPSGLADAPEDETDEELALFFVALSRARDYLILSRTTVAESGRALEPSPLLALLDSWLAGQPGTCREWPSGRTEVPEPEEIAVPGKDLPLYSVSMLETYERCPRRYFYQYSLHLPGYVPGDGYPRLHTCLRQTLDWLEMESAVGPEPNAEALEAKLEEVWAVSGPVGHLHEQKYKDSAREILTKIPLLRDARGNLGRVTLYARLTNCRVSLRPDVAQQRPDKTLVFARRLTGKPRDDDARDKKLALLRRAAAETYPDQPSVLELHYLADGVRAEIEPAATEYKAKLEADRLLKFERAAQGITLRLFSPTPQSNDECHGCAYTLICPL